MKIAIASTHGTGKSTFAKALTEELNCNYIYDVAREEAPKKGFPISEDTPTEVQLWLVMRQWELEKTTPEDWVADKCLFDYLVYGDIILKDEEIKKIIKRIVEDNAHYDFVFYIPIEFPMEEDGLRSKELQPIVDKYYKEYLERRGIKYTTLSGSPEERISQALEYLKSLK